jgi:N6-adenosine-specific RNA methylase IME4
MRWQVLYGDPPWYYQNWTDAKNGAAKSAYDTVKHEEMLKWRVDKLAAPDSLMFLWCTWPKLEQGLELLRAWGFTYVTTPFVWNKVYKDGSPYCGLGFWSRSATEFVLMGKRGRGVPRAKTATKVMQVVTAPIGRHSAKPLEIYDRIEELVGRAPKKLELFARLHRVNWWATGLELDGKDIKDFIEEQNKGKVAQ